MKKVIIIDDIKHVLDKKNSFLDRSAIEVYPVPTNAEALLLHREIKSDMIITYLDMPGMSGEEFCSAIRNEPDYARVSIILVSPRTQACYERSRQCRANDVIPTPVDPDVLLEKVRDLLHIARRASYRVPVSIQVKGDVDGKPFLGFCENLSASGMFIGSDRKLRLGDRLVCSFLMESEGHIKLEAKVMRTDGKPKKDTMNHYGLEFIDVAPALAADIDRFVRAILNK